MKKFKKIEAFEGVKMAKEQMHQTTGGAQKGSLTVSSSRARYTTGTYSSCDMDGCYDGDC